MSKKKMLMRKFGSVIVNNTFIGGVASTINTPALLAAKLINYPSGTTFSAANIQNFTIVGDDIECYIGVDYKINTSVFKNNLNIKYYNDLDNRVKDLNPQAFNGCDYMPLIEFNGIINLTGSYVGSRGTVYDGSTKTIILENCISVPNDAFYGADYYKTIINIPLCVNLGTTPLNDNAFSYIRGGSIIYAHPSLATSNGGAPDGDLAYATSAGCDVRYVIDFTAPNPITNLTIGNVYSTAIQLNFTAPTGSTNAIDFYEVWLNGKSTSKTVTASGQNITGLTTATLYDVQLKTVDIYYNKSELSNIASATTL